MNFCYNITMPNIHKHKHRHKKAILILLIAFVAISLQIIRSDKELFKAAFQLDNPETAIPVACFKANTHAGMKNANESVIFGTRDNSEDLGATFEFDASCTKDTDTARNKLRYYWDFGDETEEEYYPEANYKTEHIYWKTGKYTIQLLVKDDSENRSVYRLEVNVVKNNGPIIDLQVSPETGTYNEEFTFDASATTHDQFRKEYLEFCWDFDGDQVMEIACSKNKEKVKHAYPYGTTGKKTVLLEVRDPASGSITKEYTVQFIENTSPVANIFLIPESEGTFNTEFIIDASFSTDLESDFKCRIDSDYSGKDDIIYDQNFSNTCSWHKKFTTTGTKKIHIQLEDEDQSRIDEFLTVNINDSSEYFSYLNKQKVISGLSYKMYIVEDNLDSQPILLHEDNYSNEKILKTYSVKNDMNPNTNATRAELIKMAFEAFDIATSGIKSGDNLFVDLSKKDWYYKYIVQAYKINVVKGYQQCNNNNFCELYAKPNDTITRAEALAIIFRAADFDLYKSPKVDFKDLPKSHWAFDYVETAKKYDLISPISEKKFGVNLPITRSEIAEILYKLMNQ